MVQKWKGSIKTSTLIEPTTFDRANLLNERTPMEAYNIDQCICQIRNYAEEIIQFAKNGAINSEAHEVERGLFSLILNLGLIFSISSS